LRLPNSETYRALFLEGRPQGEVENATAPIWTILVIGPPTAGKSKLARRLLKNIPGSVRVNPDELRLMLFDDLAPIHDEDLVYIVMSDLRKSALSYGHSVIIDSTAPRHMTREFFLTEARRSRHLVVVMDVDRKILLERARAAGKLSPLKAFDAVWQEPHRSLPMFKFKNDNKQQFETSFFLLMEFMNHEYTHHRSLLRSVLRWRRRDDGPVRRESEN